MSKKEQNGIILDILGMDWTVTKKSKVFIDNHICHGSCSPPYCEIEINTDYSKEVQTRTFIHELLHAISDAMSLSELYSDEKTIDALTTGLYQVIKSNNLDLKKGI